MINYNTYEVIIGIVSLLLPFVCMVMIINILTKAKVAEKIVKKVLKVVVLLGFVTGFLSLYIIYIN